MILLMIPENEPQATVPADEESNQLRRIYEKLIQKKKANEERLQERDERSRESIRV